MAGKQAKPTDADDDYGMEDDRVEVDAKTAVKARVAAAKAKPLPEAKVVEAKAKADPFGRVKLGGFAIALFAGWLFVLGANKFHVTAPVVFVCLGYFAILMTVVNLWRTGAAAVAVDEGEAWARPLGARGELEKEKKTLLKAIKEAEFDFAIGKLSKADSESLIRQYRARAIEVIKELDGLTAGKALSKSEQIQREVDARLALDGIIRKRTKDPKVATTAAKPVAPVVAPVAAPAETKPEPPAEARIDLPPAKPMPGVLMIVLGLMATGVVVNFVTGAVVAGVIGIVLIAGVLAGNDAVRKLVIGLSLLAMLVPAWRFVDLSNQHDLTGRNIALLVLFGLGTPLLMIWVLLRSDVRDWMFRQNFKLETVPVAAVAASGVDDDDDDDEIDAEVDAPAKAEANEEARAADAVEADPDAAAREDSKPAATGDHA